MSERKRGQINTRIDKSKVFRHDTGTSRMEGAKRMILGGVAAGFCITPWLFFAIEKSARVDVLIASILMTVASGAVAYSGFHDNVQAFRKRR